MSCHRSDPVYCHKSVYFPGIVSFTDLLPHFPACGSFPAAIFCSFSGNCLTIPRFTGHALPRNYAGFIYSLQKQAPGTSGMTCFPLPLWNYPSFKTLPEMQV